jgi:hypothetical protein
VVPTGVEAGYVRRMLERGWRTVVAAVALASAVGAGCGSQTADARGTSDLYTSLCANERASPCGTAAVEQACLSDARHEEQDARQYGCIPELDAYLRCASAHPIVRCGCIESGCSPEVDESCQSLMTSFQACIDWLSPGCLLGVRVGLAGNPADGGLGAGNPASAEGGTSSGGSVCSVDCPDLASTCQGNDPNGPVGCTCTSGPHAGRAFQAEDCSGSLLIATGHSCASGKPEATAGTGGSSGTTAGGAGIGEACSPATGCLVPLVCALTLCHDPCESSRDCPVAERCVSGGQSPQPVCQLPAEARCTPSGGCPSGEICASDGACRDPCSASGPSTSSPDCLPNQICVDGACGDASELLMKPDGGLAWAG